METMSNNKGNGQWATVMAKKAYVAHCLDSLKYPEYLNVENINGPLNFTKKMKLRIR